MMIISTSIMLAGNGAMAAATLNNLGGVYAAVAIACLGVGAVIVPCQVVSTVVSAHPYSSSLPCSVSTDTHFLADLSRRSHRNDYRSYHLGQIRRWRHRILNILQRPPPTVHQVRASTDHSCCNQDRPDRRRRGTADHRRHRRQSCCQTPHLSWCQHP